MLQRETKACVKIIAYDKQILGTLRESLGHKDTTSEINTTLLEEQNVF